MSYSLHCVVGGLLVPAKYCRDFFDTHSRYIEIKNLHLKGTEFLVYSLFQSLEILLLYKVLLGNKAGIGLKYVLQGKLGIGVGILSLGINGDIAV